MQILQHGYARALSKYPIEIMVTLSFRHFINVNDHMRVMANEFIRDVAKKRKIQIAGIIVLNRLHRPHLHLFLFGVKRNIFDLSSAEANGMWQHGNANVSKPRSQSCIKNTVGSNLDLDYELQEDDGLARYAGINITPNQPDSYDIYWFNIRQLRKYESPPVVAL